MKRAAALAVLFAVGACAALVLGATAHAGISCATDSAAEVAGASVTDLGNSWSQPGQGDLWDVNMPAIAYDMSVYAQDAAGARTAAKASLDQQIASLGCATTTQATTTAPSTVTVTLPAATVTDTVTTVAPLWSPVQTVTVTQATTSTEVATVTTPAARAAPINVTVNVSGARCRAAKPAKTKH